MIEAKQMPMLGGKKVKWEWMEKQASQVIQRTERGGKKDFESIGFYIIKKNAVCHIAKLANKH